MKIFKLIKINKNKNNEQGNVNISRLPKRKHLAFIDRIAGTGFV